jgi:hypothetical protein
MGGHRKTLRNRHFLAQKGVTEQKLRSLWGTVYRGNVYLYRRLPLKIELPLAITSFIGKNLQSAKFCSIFVPIGLAEFVNNAPFPLFVVGRIRIFSYGF